MLIIDKKENILTLQSMGADDRLISKIFLTEGCLISAIGAGIGLILGIALCLLQQYFGLLRLGEGTGTFVVDAYPVRLMWVDVIAVMGIVSLLGFCQRGTLLDICVQTALKLGSRILLLRIDAKR